MLERFENTFDDFKDDLPSFEGPTKSLYELFVSRLLEFQSYKTVESFLIHFSLRDGDESFIEDMLEKDELIGFDCEWRPNSRKGVKNKVSILQVWDHKKGLHH
ncbi:hypothetical protein QVD17_32105 [Tagetes erecta]|uniref:Uncharacterized protein n=1 Tax=Tagetes erecta TaxID=13708 RepID=A0AAD8K7D7_TARER|nr:hypothetical protein QVD17_32105 [Tagetes erecta]